MKIISKQWKPQDLLDDLQMYIDEENDSYMNGRRTAMCMARDYLKAYFDTGLAPEQVKDMAENAETMLLTWFESRYGFPAGELMRMCEAKQDGRLVVLDEPRQPLVWGDDDHNTILCPNCDRDLMGGFPFALSCEGEMFQCPYCGQPIDGTKSVTREETEAALAKREA